MENTALDLNQPRFQRALVYRPQLRLLYYVSLTAVPLFFFVCALNLYWFSHDWGVVITASLGCLLGANGMIFAQLWLKPLAYDKVLLLQNSLKLEKRGVWTEIPFHRIARVEFSSVPYVGGSFVMHTKDGEAHKFSVGLERSDYVLDAVAQAEPALMANADLEHYRRMSIVIDHALARLQSNFADWPTLALSQMGLPLVLTMAVLTLFSVRGFSEALFVFAGIGVLNGIISLFFWTAFEAYHMGRKNWELKINPLNPLRHIASEQKLRLAFRLVHALTVSGLVYWICFAP